MRAALALLIAGCLASGAAEGGAWTLDQGRISVFAGTTASRASRLYGAPGRTVVFNKLMSQIWMEYGLTDAVTLYAAPEYTLAQSDLNGTGRGTIQSSSVETGLRILLLSRIGMVAVQTSVKSAGAFDMSVSSSGESGRQFETRLLYGKSLKLFGDDMFFDLEAAKRWIARPRPDEVVLDATLGWQATKNNQLLLQSFNFATTGTVTPPYRPYGLSKLQASWVHRLSRRWSMQTGYFVSVAGRNIVQETGVVTSVWFRT